MRCLTMAALLSDVLYCEFTYFMDKAYIKSAANYVNKIS